MIGLEILKSLGRFFLHPLTYVFVIAAFMLGFQRVKRERKDFHTRVFDVIQQVTSPLVIALIFGLAVSVVTLLLGIEIPVGMLALIMAIWLILLPFRNARWLSITVAGSLALIIAPFLPEAGTNWSFLNQWIIDIQQMDLLNLAWLFTVLFVAESLLILADGWKQTSPAIVKSKRGKMVGEHIASRLWFLPIFLVFPVGEWSAVSWWPLFPLTSGETFGLALVPFVLGFQAKLHGEYPIDGVKKIGKHLVFVNMIVITFAIAAYFYSLMILFVPAAILIGREIVFLSYKLEEKKRTSLFNRQESGMKILGVLPHSTAHKMGLDIGEVIVKANGREVSSQREFYDALQQNSAYCKLEVLDLAGELRFAQSSIFQGDHYQIGCLFVPDDEMGNLSYRGLRSSVVIHQDRSEVEKQQNETKTPPTEEPMDAEIEHHDSDSDRFIDEAEQQTEEIPIDSNDKQTEEEKEIFTSENHEESAATEDSEDRKQELEPEDEVVSEESDDNKKVSQLEKGAYEMGQAYGQASGLANFYDEFRQTKTKRNKWAPTLDEDDQSSKK